MKHFKTLGIVVLFLLLFSAVGITQKKPFTVAMDQDGIQRVEILAGEYFFDPNHIIVKVNIPVEIKIKKEQGIVPHAFVLKAPDAGIEIAESLSADPKTIKFTPKKTGKYPFYCDKKLLFFESHREKGMEGILEVQE